MLQTILVRLAHFFLTFFLLLPANSIGLAQQSDDTSVEVFQLRTSPVTNHLSFDDRSFLQEEFIELSNRRSLEQRGIEFTEGKFGEGIRINRIPDPPDSHNMTGIDLDLVTAAMFNTRPDNTMGYTQPMLWAGDRLNARLGAVAFWVKGEVPFHGLLFEQTSVAFGRTERDLLGVFLTVENKLAAYLRDASYKRHELRSEVEWDSKNWNHIVFNWDRAEGLELWLNGERIATDRGEGGWFETAPAGLFHLPMPAVTYDELYLLDRPLRRSEIRRLISENRPPAVEAPNYRRENYDAGRLARISGGGTNRNLPEARPGQYISFTEVWPEFVGDGNIPGWYVIDGRNEMAWPHPFAFFTVIPGDADFHAEQVEIQTPTGSDVNYVTMTGNLTGMELQSHRGGEESAELFRVPSGSGFFYGSTVTAANGSTFRIPFREAYGDPHQYSFQGAAYRIPYDKQFGSPTGFKGNVLLPISGKKRLQNVGLYHYKTLPTNGYRPDGEMNILALSDNPVLNARSSFKIHAVTARDERTFAVASSGSTDSEACNIDIGGFQRLNILSKPYQKATGVTAVTLSIPLQTDSTEETLFVRVHDPALPLRLWNEFAVRLKNFDNDHEKLLLTIDFHDMVLTGGDRLWISLGTAGRTEVRIGDSQRPAQLFTDISDAWQVADAWADKQLIPAKAQYSKMYGYMPWKFDDREPSLEHPYMFGGPFDMILPARVVERVASDHFLTNFLIRMSGPDFRGGHPVDPQTHRRIILENPDKVPEWALYMRDFNRKRHAIIDWWLEQQNPDGQIGGGWNDDNLFMISGLKDILFDSDDNARQLHDAIHTGFEQTHIYRDGFCNLHPIDRMHDADFISERYNTVIHNLGQPHAAEREMESAWRFGKPEATPVNYSEGLPFRSSVNVFNWFWGTDRAEPYRLKSSLDEVAEELRLYTSVLDKDYFYNLTEARVHTTSQAPYGSRNMYPLLLGGSHGPRWDAHPDLAVKWLSGGGPDIARIVLSADDRSFEAVAYSFHPKVRELQMRLMRINDGHYRISIYKDPLANGQPEQLLWSAEKNLDRFDTVTLPLPPHTPVVIKIEQIREHQRPAQLPDLAINPWGAVMHGSVIQATIHNLGNAPAENITVRLFNGDQLLQEKQIGRLGAPTDFEAKRAQVVFNNVPPSMGRKNLKVVIDPDNRIREILTDNNSAPVTR